MWVLASILARSLAIFPVRVPLPRSLLPGLLPGALLGRVLGASPGVVLGEPLGKAFGELPVEVLDEHPVEVLGNIPGEGLGEVPGVGLSQHPGEVLGDLPGVGLGQRLGDVLGGLPGVGLEDHPGVVLVLAMLCPVLALATLGRGLVLEDGVGELPGEVLGMCLIEVLGELPGEGLVLFPAEVLGVLLGSGLGLGEHLSKLGGDVLGVLAVPPRVSGVLVLAVLLTLPSSARHVLGIWRINLHDTGWCQGTLCTCALHYCAVIDVEDLLRSGIDQRVGVAATGEGLYKLLGEVLGELLGLGLGLVLATLGLCLALPGEGLGVHLREVLGDPSC